MRIIARLPRAARRSAGLLLALMLLTVPAVVLASHQFSDVPTGHPFHTEIGAIAKAGITAGFGDGTTFRPGDPVTRQAMAAFMQRGFGRVVLATDGLPITQYVSVPAGDTATMAVPVRSVSITVPGANNAFGPKQLIHLRGSVDLSSSMATAAPHGCPCEFYAEIRDAATNGIIGDQLQTFESTSTNISTYSFDIEALVSASPGARTYRLFVGLAQRATPSVEASYTIEGTSSLSAMSFPFGANGTSEL